MITEKELQESLIEAYKKILSYGFYSDAVIVDKHTELRWLEDFDTTVVEYCERLHSVVLVNEIYADGDIELIRLADCDFSSSAEDNILKYSLVRFYGNITKEVVGVALYKG